MEWREQIERARLRRGLTKRDLARATGIARTALVRLLNTRDSNPTAATLQRFADVLDTTITITPRRSKP